MTSLSEHSTFLMGANGAYIAELYARYLDAPGSVDPSWSSFFDDLHDDARAVLSELKGASWAPPRTPPAANGAEAAPAPQRNGKANGAAAGEAAAPTQAAVDQLRAATLDSLRALMLIRAYRVRGHLLANLDPLGLEKPQYHSELDPKIYGFGDGDYDRPIFINNVLGHESATLREIVAILHQTYCGSVGVEFMHIQDPGQKQWIQERLEGPRNQTEFTEKGKRAILERLTAAETFERFCQVKYPGTKRFGLEGADALIPGLEQILKRGGQLGLSEVVLGMPHRGRLNVLTNVVGKSFSAIFSEFQGNSANPEDVQGSGDVKYHLGTSADREFDGNSIHLSLTANPSHLEAVNPVAVGKARAKQQQRKDVERGQVACVLMHGDAAFAGQGLVPETLALSELRGYRIGGTIHYVVNNQIGFTTSPNYARSGPYPTDVAKGIQAPIFHVNGDDAEAVVHVSRIAIEFRQTFKKDVVVDMFCYRRQGHNEGDEPGFTQPLMYKAIHSHPTTREIYGAKLVEEGVVAADEPERMVAAFMKRLEAEFEAATAYRPNKADWLEGKWAGMEIASGDDRRGETAVPVDTLREVGLAIAKVPEGVKVHPKIVRQLRTKQQMIERGEGIDWATAEALAFGTLLAEGIPVRLSGQDVGRGTFSQRHAVLYDQETEERYIPLAHVKPSQATFEVHDSPLSEAAVLGFEYGYTLAEPNALVMWEAQFGDFANGAQVIIDQFISSGESKWLRMSGVVLLLPHGFEGNGPEHSSARLERFLQLCGEDNLQVVNATTPANYFHVLRRQMHRNFRKPLVMMTPKSLLRHKLCVSTLTDMGPESSFHRLLPETETLLPDDRVRRVVLCSGKVYYDLYQEREARGIKDVAIVRLEQVYPFPRTSLGRQLGRYPNADVIWCQEEPINMGAWYFVDRRIETVLGGLDGAAKRPRYIGRPDAASPATGLLRRHNREQAQIVDDALTVN